jgi:hypothetical protein
MRSVARLGSIVNHLVENIALFSAIALKVTGGHRERRERTCLGDAIALTR